MILFVSAHSQSLGFIQSECGIIPNPSYGYVNYHSGSHGYGYKLYHNGDLIAEEYNDVGGYWGDELRFIDDTTGFFIVNQSPPGLLKVYKITGNFVIYMGESGGLNYDFFVVSRHTIYIISNVDFTKFLFINRLSDLRPQKYLVIDTSLVSDTTVFDTVQGIALCDGLHELNYHFHTTSDTLIYTIKFKADTLSNIRQLRNSDFIIYPNPARDYIRIKPPKNENHYSIKIFDVPNIIRKSLIIDNDAERGIYIGDLDKGVYFIVIDNANSKWVVKLIKI